jgi:hypothetical protein
LFTHQLVSKLIENRLLPLSMVLNTSLHHVDLSALDVKMFIKWSWIMMIVIEFTKKLEMVVDVNSSQHYFDIPT